MPTTISGSTGIDKVHGAVITSANIVDDSIQPNDLVQKLTLGTAIATTSGTYHDFTGIPSWVKRITLLFSGVSTNSTSPYLIQLGDSGGIETTGYVSSTQYIAGAYPGAVGTYINSNGAQCVAVPTAADTYRGRVTIENLTGNLWVISGSIGDSTARGFVTQADKTLSGTLDRIRLTTVNGTDTFDAGSINILYEG